MEKKINKFLLVSLIVAIVICSAVFFGTTGVMRGKTTNTINEIGEIYMSEMNKQVQEKFISIINLRLSQVEGVIRRTPPNTSKYDQNVIEQLKTSAEVREFKYLALFRSDGKHEIIYGFLI